eukprot:4571749-Pyramimonas_sp.AAC.1
MLRGRQGLRLQRHIGDRGLSLRGNQETQWGARTGDDVRPTTMPRGRKPVSYTHLRAHETGAYL